LYWLFWIAGVGGVLTTFGVVCTIVCMH